MKSLKQTATEISEHRHLSSITSKSKLYRTRTERVERTMLEIKELTKYYGKNLAVDQVTFTVPNGQVGVLLGPNGSGKSTVYCGIRVKFVLKGFLPGRFLRKGSLLMFRRFRICSMR